MSSGSQGLPMGIVVLELSSMSREAMAITRGVLTEPGATALTLIPRGPSSTAIVRVRAISPAFAAP